MGHERTTFAGLPGCLIEFAGEPRWATWTWDLRDGRWGPQPVGLEGIIEPGHGPSSLEVAAQAARRASGHAGGGLMLQLQDLPGLAAIELAWARDPRTGLVRPWVEALIEGRGYAERTPSGTGLLLLGRVAMSLVIEATSLSSSEIIEGVSLNRVVLHASRVSPIHVEGRTARLASHCPAAL